MGLLTEQLEKDNIKTASNNEEVKFGIKDVAFLLKLILDSQIRGTELQQAVTTVIKLQKLKGELDKHQIKP